MRHNYRPQNNELERTRSTQTAVGSRRSIQCSTHKPSGGIARPAGGAPLVRTM
jgi:hypothetical protein